MVEELEFIFIKSEQLPHMELFKYAPYEYEHALYKFCDYLRASNEQAWLHEREWDAYIE